MPTDDDDDDNAYYNTSVHKIHKPLRYCDVNKGLEVSVRFNMKHWDGTPAPSEIYCGVVTRVTAAGVVWVKFNKMACYPAASYTFNMRDIVHNGRDFFRVVEEEEEEDEEEQQQIAEADDDCANVLLNMFQIEI